MKRMIYTGQLTTLELFAVPSEGETPDPNAKPIFAKALATGRAYRVPDDHPIVQGWIARGLFRDPKEGDPEDDGDTPVQAVQAPQADPAQASGLIALGTEPRPSGEVGPETLVGSAPSPDGEADMKVKRSRGGSAS